MIIAMPTFYQIAGCGNNSESGEQTFTCDDPSLRQDEVFRVELLRSFIPFVENNYRAIASQSGRAYAGLSQGGAYGNWIIINSPEVFGYYGIWSPACVFLPYVDCGRPPSYLDLLSDTAQSILGVHLAAGYSDTFGTSATVSFIGSNLEAAGIPYRLHLTPTDVEPPAPMDDWVKLSGHNWQVWQQGLRDAMETVFFSSISPPSFMV